MSESGSWSTDEAMEKIEESLQKEYNSNGDFNTALNESDPVKFKSLMDDASGYSFESSWLLFCCERKAYYEELDSWQNAKTESKHKKIKQVLKDYDQRSVLQELIVAAKRQRIAPFVGAGLSLDCKFPLWGKALEDIMKRMDGFDDTAVKKALADGDYLEAAQLLWEEDDTQLTNYIRNKFAFGEIPDGKIKGAVKKLPEFCSGCVVTTNFDPVLETVFESFEGRMHGVQFNKFAQKLIEGDSCLLKLHGDHKDHETYVFTKDQYLEAYGDPIDFTRPLPKSLRQIFVSHSLLFLGCSLDEDKTLELFQKVVDEGAFEIPNHFAILPEPNGGESKRQKETRLLKLKVRPIWYPSGEHDHVGMYMDLITDAVNGKVVL